MNKNNYTLQPIDTNDVVLPEELNELAEMKHPCLVPYEELTEVEKEYDRNTSQETLKLIIKFGFKITK